MTERFDTDSVAEPEQFAYWREVICAVYVQLEADPVGNSTFDTPFDASVELDVVGPVRVSRVRSDGQIVRHTEQNPRDDLLVSVQIDGVGIISQNGRDAMIRPGDFSSYDATRPYQLRFDEPFEHMVLQFPRDHVALRSIDLGTATARPLARGTGMNDVVVACARTLRSTSGDLPRWARSRLADQFVDSLATALAVSGSSADPNATADLERRHLVIDHVRANLGQPDLSVAGIAESLGTTTRSLQRLFADGDSLSTTIRRLRLQAAHDALRDPGRRRQSVGFIGGCFGFGDPSAFARAFRREFGVSPTSVRSQHRTVSPEA